MDKTIFIVVPGQTREDYSGRDYIEFILDDDYDIDYFTSRESAQAWIDEQQSEANVEYRRALKRYPALQKAYEIKRDNHNRKEAEILARARAADVPYKPVYLYNPAPTKPVLNNFVDTQYQIWEIDPHE